MSNTLEIILKAKDEASKAIAGLADQAKAAEKALGGLGASTSTTSTTLGMGAKSATALAVEIAAVATAAATAGAVIAKFVGDFSKAAGDIDDLSKKLGTTATSIQVMQYQAKVAGVDTSSLTTALVQMEKAAARTPEKFAQIGISFGQLKTSNPQELLGLISDGFRGITDENDRAKVAMDLFGRSGTEMLKMLGSDFREMQKEAEGASRLTEEQVKAGAALDDQLTKLGASADTLKLKLGAAFAGPSVIGAVGTLQRLLDKLANSKAFEILAGVLTHSSPWALPAGAGGAAPTPEGETPTQKKARELSIEMFNLEKTIADQLAADEKAAEKARKQSIVDIERQIATEKRLFDQRSQHMGANPLVGVGGFAGAFYAPGKYDVTGGISMNDPHKVYNLWGDRSKFLPEQMDGNIHIAAEFQKQAADSAQRWALALQGVALMAGAIGGKIGATAQVMGNIAESFKDWNKEGFNKTGAVAAGVGQIGGLIGGSTGSFLQGAGGGAAAGSAFGVPGAIVGGILGGIGGLFGASSKQKAELADAKKQLEALSDTAKKFGIDLTAAFSTKSIAQVKQAIADVNKAQEDQQKRIAGMQTAAGGFNAFVTGGGIGDQASADRSSLYAGAIFAGMVKDTGDVVGALAAIRPALDEMAKKAEEMGLSLGKGVSNLIGMNHVLEGNEGLAQQLSGLNQMMKGFGDAGMMTRDLFQAFGADTSEVFKKLVEGGATGTQAMTLMQPTLQQLYEGQKRHGYAVDEATQALIDQAKAEGLVGDQFMSANERIVDLLEILVETMGGKLPEAYRKAGDAAEEYGRRATDSMPNYGSPDNIRYNDGTTADTGMALGGIVAPRSWVMPRAAKGILVPNRPGRGTAVVMGEAASAEVAAPVNALFGSLGDMMAAKVAGAVGGGGNVPVHVTLNLDGRVFLRAMASGMRSRGPEAAEFRAAYSGAV